MVSLEAEGKGWLGQNLESPTNFLQGEAENSITFVSEGPIDPYNRLDRVAWNTQISPELVLYTNQPFAGLRDPIAISSIGNLNFRLLWSAYVNESQGLWNLVLSSE